MTKIRLEIGLLALQRKKNSWLKAKKNVHQKVLVFFCQHKHETDYQIEILADTLQDVNCRRWSVVC